jgi:hypothetical protein
MSNGKGYVVIEGKKNTHKESGQRIRQNKSGIGQMPHVVPVLQDVLYIVLLYSCRFIHRGIILFHCFLYPCFRFSLTIEGDF